MTFSNYYNDIYVHCCADFYNTRFSNEPLFQFSDIDKRACVTQTTIQYKV